MSEIKALFKFSPHLPTDALIIDTTSSSSQFRELSPFVLSAPPAKIFENLWQFSKVYPSQVYANGEPTPEWEEWRRQGWNDIKPHRYPMGKGAIPLYSYWQGKHLGYIDARKQIYIPEYAKNVIRTHSFKLLQEQYRLCQIQGRSLILLDYDAYDHRKLGMSLNDVVNNPERKMGHAFVLLMLLEGYSGIWENFTAIKLARPMVFGNLSLGTAAHIYSV